jgi:hypothetical protein
MLLHPFFLIPSISTPFYLLHLQPEEKEEVFPQQRERVGEGRDFFAGSEELLEEL